MIIVKITGGLGNQLFQYAAAKSLALKHNAPLYLDLSFYESDVNKVNRKFYLPYFNNEYKILSRSDSKLFLPEKGTIFSKLMKRIKFKNYAYYFEPKGGDPVAFNTITPPVYLDGVFQDERYFAGKSTEIRKLLTPQFVFKQKDNLEVLNKIRNSHSVAVHIRRGDYLRDPKHLAYHGICSWEYYRNSIELLEKKIKNPHLFVFTDDKEEMKKEFNTSIPHTLVSGAEEQDFPSDLVEFQLMSNCQHQIIANSSFSWWAAWLNSNQNKLIIGPEKWFVNEQMNQLYHHLLPAGWIKL